MSKYEEALEEYRIQPQELRDSVNRLTRINLDSGSSGSYLPSLLNGRILTRLADLHPHQADALAWLNTFIAAIESDNLESARQQREKALAVIDLYRVSQIDLSSLVSRLNEIDGGDPLE